MIKMFKKTEVPNIVLTSKQFPRDEMSVYIRKKTILFKVNQIIIGDKI